MACIASIDPSANSFVEYKDFIGVGSYLLNKKNLLIYPVANPMYKQDDKILWSLTYGVYDRKVFAGKLNTSVGLIPSPVLFDRTRTVGVSFMSYSSSSANYYGFVSSSSLAFYKESQSGKLSKITKFSLNSSQPVGIFDVIDGQNYLLVFVNNGIIRFYKVNVTTGSGSSLSSGSSLYSVLPHSNYITYIGFVNGEHIFAFIGKGSNDDSFKLVFVGVNTSGLRIIGSYGIPDFDATVLPVVIAPIKREDGSYYVVGLCPNDDTLTPFAYLLKTDGSITGISISGSIDISSLSLPFAAYDVWCFDYYNGSNKYFLFGFFPSADVDNDLMVSVNKVPFWLVYLDETNQSLVVKDSKVLDLRELPLGLLPINQDNSTYYVLQNYSLSKIKISNEKLLVAKSFIDKRYIALGIDDNGRLWGIGDSFVEILPEYIINGYVDWRWSNENAIYEGTDVDNSIILNIYDEQGNRVSKKVNLAILSGNAVFKSNSSYTISVTTSDTSDTTVDVTIKDGGLVYINTVVE